MAPARTGNDNKSKIAVSRTLQTKSGIRSHDICRILTMVEMKLIAPKILLTPARCREKILRSTAAPACPSLEMGGYIVHPVPTPLSNKADVNNKVKAGGRSQNLMLFRRGNAMSGALIMMGTSQLPKPPIITGMTKKKIMTKACEVTITL